MVQTTNTNTTPANGHAARAVAPVIKPFTLLQANVKESINIGLEPCTLIVGKNKAYKTAILDALRLALTGKHPIGPHPSDLIELAADPKQGISVSLQGPSGFAEFELPVTSEGAKKPIWEFEGDLKSLTLEQRRRIVPSEAVKDLLSFGPARAREAVLKRFGPPMKAVPTPLGLDDAQLTLWKEGVTAAEEEYGKEAPASTILAGVAAWMRRASRSKNTEANELEKRVTLARSILNEETAGAENLDALKFELKKAVAWEESVLDRRRLDKLQEELAPIAVQVSNIEDKKIALKAEHETRLEQLARKRDEAQKATLELQEHLKKDQEGLFFGTKLIETFASAIGSAADPKTAKCPFCWSEAVDLTERHKVFCEKTSARKRAVEELQAKATTAFETLGAVNNAIQEEERTFSNQFTLLHDSMGTLRAQYASIEGRIEEIKRRLADPYSGPPSADLRVTIERIEEGLKARNGLEDGARELRQLRRAVEDAKTLEKEAMTLAQGALKASGDNAITTISKYMPTGIRCEYRLDETHWEWCVVGEDNRPHREFAASGMEWSTLALALPIAWREGNPLGIALYDDRDIGTLDHEMLYAFLAALKAAVDRGDLTQAIVAWNRPEEIRTSPPPGWLVIQRERDHAHI